MKKLIIILLLILIFIVGCKSNPQVKECVPIDCARPPQGCSYENPVYENNCLTGCGALKCSEGNPVNVQTETVKEFTVEADDLGLYPEDLTVNKNDKIKLIFKVRTEKVYYGGLEFRSDLFGDTGKVLPGTEKTIEFTADKTFSYASYWPLTNNQKATGTINVV